MTRKKKRVRLAALGAATTALSGLAWLSLTGGGCARRAERIAEQRIDNLLPQFLGPADKWSSRVRDNPAALLRGRLRRVRVDGENVRVSDELTLDHLTLDVADLRVDTREKRVSSVGAIGFSARLSETSLNRYLRARRPDIPGLSVRLRPGEATIRARPELAGLLGIPLSVRGTLSPRSNGGGTLLDFVPGGANVSIVPIPGIVLRFVAERVNPLVDLAALRAPIRVEQVAVGEGEVTLTGSVDGEALLRAAATGAVPGG